MRSVPAPSSVSRRVNLVALPRTYLVDALHSRFRDLGLLWKLLMPGVAVAVVLAVSGAYVVSHQLASEARTTMERELSRARLETEATFRDAGAYLGESVTSEVNTRGTPEAVVARDLDVLRQHLLGRLAVWARVGILVATDANGTGLVEANRGTGEPVLSSGKPWGREALVAAALRGPTNVHEHRQVGLLRAGGVAYLAVAAPVGEGRVVGAIMAGTRMDALAAVAAVRTGGRVAVFDERGDVVADSGGTDRGRRAAAPPGVGMRVRERQAGRSVQTAYAPMRIGGVTVGTLAASLPDSFGLASIRKTQLRWTAILACALAGLVGLGYLVSRALLAQVRVLLEATRALGRGDLSVRAPVLGRDELGELAEGYNAMAEALRASYEQLEDRVVARTNTLASALERLDHTNAELVEANQAKSIFLASMSHELRTPLSTILLSAELLAEGTIPITEDRVRQVGKRVLSSGRHLLGIIDDLLDMSRIDAGRLELSRRPEALGPLLEEVEATIRPLALAKGLTLDIPDPDGIRVLADALRVRQVLLNLLTNAVTWTPAGGRVWVEVAARHGEIGIAVHDTGAGVPRRDQRRIFEPFEQGERHEGGFGLGLAISKRIAELHGGALRVSSIPGRGATFTLTLPPAGRHEQTA